MKPSVVIETPPDRQSYSFESYQDVIKALTKKDSNKFSELRKEQTNYGTVYKETLSKFESEEMKIANSMESLYLFVTRMDTIIFPC